MTLISTSIPNLINGVSQQPPSIRLSTQAEVQENGLSSVVDGLVKRPPTEHKGFPIEGLSTQQQADMSKGFFHTIRNSDNTVNFLSIQKDGTVTTFDTNGVANTNNTVSSSASAYVTGLSNPATELTAVTVADFTFLANRTKTVAKDTTTSPTRNAEALVYVAKSDYGANYEVTVTKGGSTYTRSITTMGSTQGSTADSQNAEKSIQTDRIASNLRINVATDATYYGSTGASSIPGINITLYGNVIHYQCTSSSDDFEIEVKDSRGGDHLRAFKGETPDFKKLPNQGALGFVIKVTGDNSKGQDDYFVKFSQDTNNGQYIWKETVAPGILTRINKTTMPHTIKYFGSSGYTFDAEDYTDRGVGDDDTNPFPSFVGQKINDVFFYRNRLGFLADENVIFSQAGEFFNFFNKTVLIGVDSAPIDVAVSNNQVSILKHAVPFNETLLLFSDFSQFRLSAGQLLTPESVSIDVATNFEASLDAKPVGAGKYVYFPTKTGIFSGLREYFVDTDTETNDAIEVTGHVPNYIKGTIRHIAGSSSENMILVQTDDDPKTVYVYRYYWSGRDKLQSSWSKWKFSGDVRYFDFNGSDVFFIVQYGDSIAVERMNLSEDDALADTSFPILLDRRIKLTSSHVTPYAGASNKTPYKNTATAASLVFVKSDGSIISAADAATEVSNNKIVYAGVPYTFKYQFSEQVMKQDKNAITTGRMQIRNVAVVYASTGFFKINITPHKNLPTAVQKTYSRLFTGRIIGGGTNVLGSVPLDTGSYRFGVLANSKNALIEIESDSHLPCAFQSAEFEAEFVVRSRRL